VYACVYAEVRGAERRKRRREEGIEEVTAAENGREGGDGERGGAKI